MHPMTNLIGADVVQISRIQASITCHQERFLQRVFTAGEIHYCQRHSATAAHRFASRFAAKEATLKVLRPDRYWFDWRMIEVIKDPSGWCGIKLHGNAAELAESKSITIFSLSMSHEGDYAFAVIIAGYLDTIEKKLL